MSYKFLFTVIVASLIFFASHSTVIATTVANDLLQNTRTTSFTGVITTLRSCYNPSGFAFTVASSSNTYIYALGRNPLIPASGLSIGLKVFGVTNSTRTCDTDPGPAVVPLSGSYITYLSAGFGTSVPIIPPTGTPPSTGNTNQNNGSSGNSGQGVMSKFQSLLNDLFKPPSSPSGADVFGGVGKVGAGSTAPTSPFNFGGPVTAPIPCDPSESTPTGTIWMIPIGPPKGGNFLYNPALAKSYRCGPPLIPGQNTLGSYTPTGICDVCLGPEDYCPNPGVGFLNALPGHGTSGCVLDTSTPQETKPQKPINGCGGQVTPDTKAAMEIKMRSDLKGACINVNHPNNPAGCGFGESFQQHMASKGDGCSDVSGLQCGSINELQRLVSLCPELCSNNGLTIEGGSEKGHLTHTPGNAVDLRPTEAIASCIHKNFKCNASGRDCVDPVTGTTFHYELPGESTNTTGVHWHMCYANLGCSF